MSFSFVDSTTLHLVGSSALLQHWEYSGIYIEPPRQRPLSNFYIERTDEQRQSAVVRSALLALKDALPHWSRCVPVVVGTDVRRLAVIDANLRWSFLVRIDVRELVEDGCVLERPDAEWNF